MIPNLKAEIKITNNNFYSWKEYFYINSWISDP